MSEFPFLKTKDAADQIGLAESTLEKMRLVGGGPPFLVVGKARIVYDVVELDR